MIGVEARGGRLLIFSLALILLAAVLPPSVQAQAIPQPPFVTAPRPGTSWEITLQYEESTPPTSSPQAATPAPPHRRPTRIFSHCGKNLTCITLTWSDGTQSEAYVTGSRVLEKNPQTGSIAALPLQDEDPALPVFTKGYQGISWLSAASYRGMASIGKTECFHFASSPGNSAPVDSVTQRDEMEAWIEAGTRIPLRIKLGEVIFNYGPVLPASPEIELPPDVAAFMAQIRKEGSALEILRRLNQR